VTSYYTVIAAYDDREVAEIEAKINRRLEGVAGHCRCRARARRQQDRFGQAVSLLWQGQVPAEC